MSRYIEIEGENKHTSQINRSKNGNLESLSFLPISIPLKAKISQCDNTHTQLSMQMRLKHFIAFA